MTISEQIIRAKSDYDEVYKSGKLAILGESQYMHPTVSGSAIAVNDVNSIEHNLGVAVKSKNLLPFPYYNDTRTISGITYTVGTDGSLTIEGTATANATFNFILASYSSALPLKVGTYTFSLGSPNTAYTQFRLGTIAEDGTIVVKADIRYSGEKEKTFTLEKDARIYINCIVGKGDAVPKTTFYPMLEFGTTATEYTPYITDLNGVKVSVYSDENEMQTATAVADGTVTGLTSLSPNMTLITDTEGVNIECQYYRDIDTFINNLNTNIALTGGN